jgi:hypothetical protein
VTKLRESVVNVAVSLGSFAVCLFVAEMMLRFLPVPSGLMAVPVTHESPIFHFIPNRDFVQSRGWNFQRVNRGHVNNDGWVNNQDYRVSEDPPLVAVIGDSFVEAEMVPYAQTFHGLLATLYEGKTRFYSFGTSGARIPSRGNDRLRQALRASALLTVQFKCSVKV